jgi:hypothetical protein
MRAASAAPPVARGATAVASKWINRILRPRSQIANCANRWCDSHFVRRAHERLCPECREWRDVARLLELLTIIGREVRQ